MDISLLIRATIGLAFFQGVFGYLGVPTIQYRTPVEIMILVLFFIFIYFLSLREDRSFKSPGLKWFSLFTLVIIISGLMNNSDLYASYRMYSRVLLPYLFFLAIYNINLSALSIQKINKFIFFMVILQIPAAVYKYLTYGVREDGIIGTFSTQAGALSTIVPLFIIGYLIALFYCYKKNPLYLLLIPGFIFFAWGGGKRAFFIFMPALILIAYFVYNKVIRNNTISIVKMFPTFVIIITLMGTVLYLGGRLNPVFNPEKERWGSFDLSYMVSQVSETQTRTETSGESIGRLSTFKAAFDRIIINADLKRNLLGDGPDKLYLEDKQQSRYGIKYGISGSTFYLISSGLLGTLSYLFLIIYFGHKTYLFIQCFQDPLYVAIAFGTFLAFFVFCFDFMFYSTAFFTGSIPSYLFFYFLAILFKHNNETNINPVLSQNN
jgi:hypothetical protein